MSLHRKFLPSSENSAFTDEAYEKGARQTMENFALLWHDIKESFAGITMLEVSKQALFGLWLIILFMPLKGVDRRDMLACLVYTMFMGAAAATLFYAIPKALVEEEASLQDQFITLMIIFAFGCIRWNVDFKDLTKIMEENIKTPPKKEFKSLKGPSHGKVEEE